MSPYFGGCWLEKAKPWQNIFLPRLCIENYGETKATGEADASFKHTVFVPKIIPVKYMINVVMNFFLSEFVFAVYVERICLRLNQIQKLCLSSRKISFSPKNYRHCFNLVRVEGRIRYEILIFRFLSVDTLNKD